MPMTTPCPKCQTPLSIPEPMPERMQCPKCAAVIKFKVPAVPAKADTPKSSPDVAIGKPATPAKKPADDEPILLSDEAPGVKSPSTTSADSTPSGVLSYLHTVIPKPIVFATYGAVGAFLGVLLLGELFMLFAPTPQDVKPLVMKVSSDIKLYPGTRSVLKVKIVRQGIEGPVRLEIAKLPTTVQFAEVVIGDKETDAEIPLEAGPLAEEGVHDVTVVATAVKNEKIKEEESVKIYLQSTPASVGLSVPSPVTVYAGGKNQFDFLISRERFEGRGDVRVEVLDLPKGVNIPIVMVPENANKGTIVVSASKEAPTHAEYLIAEARAVGDHKTAATAQFQLNILPPPGKLQMAAPPSVTVYPGTKNRLSVKVARSDFTGPIKIEVTGNVPRGITFSSEEIAADKAETVIEVYASKDIRASDEPIKGLQIVGTLQGGKETITAAIPLVLHLKSVPPTVLLAVSPKVPVYPGGQAKFGVKINRARFSGPVRIDVQGNNPAYAKIKGIVIPADQTSAEMEVVVEKEALNLQLTFPMPVQVVANFTTDDKKPGTPTAEKTTIEILPPPSDLNLTVSPEVEVYQAGKCSFTAKVARGGFLGPVAITFNNVPPGVTLTSGTLLERNTDIKLTGTATIDVEPKKYEIEVVAKGMKAAPDGKVPTAREKMTLIVKPFDPSIRPPLDIVFVLDVTKSLDAQIAGVRDGVGQFVKGLKDRELEARIGLIGFRDINFDGKEAFEVLKFNGQMFTTDAKAFAAEVGKLQAKGGGDPPESSLDAIDKAANEYPFRPNAMKVLLLITDDKPQTMGNSVKMADVQKTLRAKKIDQVHLIVKKKDLPDYAGLKKDAKGGFFDFDQATGPKGKENFAAILPMLSKEIAVTIGAPEPMAKAPGQPAATAPLPELPKGERIPEPKAEASPSAPEPVKVDAPKPGEVSAQPVNAPELPKVDAVSPPAADAPTIGGLQSTARYSEDARGRLMAVVALWTAALAAGVALMLVGAQKRYLSQSWPRISEGVKAIAAGLVSGLLAGIISQWLFLQFSTGSAWWDSISRVIGWVLLGGLIGGAMGYFVPNMNVRRAVIGGCIGGLIGVLAFFLVNLATTSVLGNFPGIAGFLARLIGASLLGLFIGAMVALAEMASRRYWLEVAFGEREIRTVTLGSATVAIGGDEKLAAVYVPNAPAKAFGFRIDKNRVFFEDFTTGKTTEAAAGDSHRVAGARVTVCSAAHATPTGASLKLVVVRDVPLMIGMPMTADDIPGLEAQGSDGVVALVSRRPNNPKIFLLRNRSKQTWTVMEADGKQRKVEPGLSIELSAKCEIDFGQVKGTLDPSKE